MTSVDYLWKVTAVDTIANTFTVEYNAANKPPVALNLQLPGSLSEIAGVVEYSAPRASLLDLAQTAPSVLDPKAVQDMKGMAVSAPFDMVAAAKAAREADKKRLGEMLFELKVTSTNVYTPPA